MNDRGHAGEERVWCDYHGLHHEASRDVDPQCVLADVSHETSAGAIRGIEHITQGWVIILNPGVFSGLGSVLIRHDGTGAAWKADGKSAGVLYNTKIDVSHETRIAAYLQATATRDQIVRDLIAAGWSQARIAREMRMGRPTVGHILGKKWKYNHGKETYSDPREGST